MRLARFAVLAVLAVGCAADLDVDREPIVNGRASPSDDSVVFLLGAGFCSGTLIAPRVVLTAKHCVMSEGDPSPVAARAVTVGIGESFRALRARYSVERIVTTPGPLEISTGFDPVGGANGSDIALLVLTEPVTEAPPIPVRRTAPDDLVGSTLLAIGFGTTPEGGSGLRLQTDALLTRTTSVLLEGIEVICSGDSGGPLLVEEDGERWVVGVASFGVFRSGAMVGSCPADADYWNRVDIQMDLIDRALRYGGECVPRGEGSEVCNGIDDDCNGTVDETCVALGGACALDTDCAFTAPPVEIAGDATLPEPVRCVAGVCALSCDAREPFLGCDRIEHAFTGESTAVAGFYCRHDGGCAGTCVAGGPGAGAVGSACTADGDCSTLACDFGVCSTRCVGDSGSCPTDEVCYADAGRCGICASPGGRPTGRGRGEPCTAATECTSGLCGREGRCALPCDTDTACGAGFRCEESECTAGERSEIGEYCEGDDDCRLGECGMRAGERFCGSPCDAPTDCASGECVIDGEEGVCAPALVGLGGACAGDAECTSGTCRDGTCAALCSATRFCPTGLDCVRDGAETVCRTTGGGCSVTGRGSPAAALMVLAALSLTLARRRR